VTEHTLTSREFAVDPLKVKKLAKNDDVVVVTNRGEPELAVLPYAVYRTLIEAPANAAPTKPRSLYDSIAGDDEVAAIDIEFERDKSLPRFIDFDDE